MFCIPMTQSPSYAQRLRRDSAEKEMRNTAEGQLTRRASMADEDWVSSTAMGSLQEQQHL